MLACNLVSLLCVWNHAARLFKHLLLLGNHVIVSFGRRAQLFNSSFLSHTFLFIHTNLLQQTLARPEGNLKLLFHHCPTSTREKITYKKHITFICALKTQASILRVTLASSSICLLQQRFALGTHRPFCSAFVSFLQSRGRFFVRLP